MRRARWLASLAVTAVTAAALAACGGETFDVPPAADDAADALGDVSLDGAQPDTTPDATPDATVDATPDATDALPDTKDASGDAADATDSADATGDGGPTACAYGAAGACPAGYFCDAPGCSKGTCKPTPTGESQSRAPACGCDGVTYWNASVAARHEMSVLAGGECKAPKACGGFAGLTCPAGSTCNYRLPNKATCSVADYGGTCWAIPASCPPIVIGSQSRACGSASCTDECNLIKLQTPWYADSSCPV